MTRDQKAEAFKKDFKELLKKHKVWIYTEVDGEGYSATYSTVVEFDGTEENNFVYDPILESDDGFDQYTKF